jgi:hypothetical protein
MECITCQSPRVSRFVDGYGHRRVFCKNCCVSFPEETMTGLPRRVHINFGAVIGGE